MKKLATISSILALSLAPVAALADDSVTLLTSKSSGSLNGAVSDDVVVVTPVAPAGGFSGGGTGTAIAVGAGLLTVLAIAAIAGSDDDDDDATSTTDSATGTN